VSATKKASTPKRATHLLIMSSKAGSMTPEIDAKLRRAFPSSLILEFDPKMDIEKLVTPRATVVVAGGDGSIGWVVRRLVDTRHPVGILSMGTFNNFAHSLGIPEDLDEAIRVIKEGRPRAITLGRVNGHVFIEACAVGLFGELIALGEAAKELAFGEVAHRLRQGTTKTFRYQLHGDLEGSGKARSLVFTNTPSIGARMTVSDSTPMDPYLEFSVHAGGSRIDIFRRILTSAVLGRDRESRPEQVFKFRRLKVTTKPEVRVYSDYEQIGCTPVTIEAELSALRVILPA